MTRRARYSALLVVSLLALGWSACDDDDPSVPPPCHNGECVCRPGASCTIPCAAPPCHIECAGNNPSCVGTCANGTCTCQAQSSCSFDCQSGPCHVDCVGDNPECAGACANGTCRCGPNASCRFACLDHNCKHHCESGAACVVECPRGDAGQGCGFDRCWTGQPIVCSGGLAVACNAPCPEGT